MKYLFFLGCHIPIRIEQYATATQAIFNRFNIKLEELREFNCCGYPIRNVDEKAYILPSVRNMALAEKEGLPIMVICNCCFASLQKAKNVLSNDASLKDELNFILAKEGLKYTGTTEIHHYLTVLHGVIGKDSLEKHIVNKFYNLNISVIQGCHILRPREVTKFDDSFMPKITEELVDITGANSLEWRGKLECCGASLAGINENLSHKLLKEKITGAQQAGAQFITPICSYCHLQFDTTQRNIQIDNSETDILPVILYPQLLGLCLGISEKQLGLSKNKTLQQKDIDFLKSLLGPPVDEKKRKVRQKKKKEEITA
jgi:heterodisulfide reductase subunit B